MPWYMFPDTTCKVLNRIANRYSLAETPNLVALLDYVTERLWEKQEQYCQRQPVQKHQTRAEMDDTFSTDIF